MDVERWNGLKGGYRTVYDPRAALGRLEAGDEGAWDELWEELHHQGDVDVASYAAVPEIVRIHAKRDVPEWQTYSLMGTIESCREKGGNPPLPDWLVADYKSAWDAIVPLGCRDLGRTIDETTVRSIIGAIAVAKGVKLLGELILNYSGEELSEMVEAFQS